MFNVNTKYSSYHNYLNSVTSNIFNSSLAPSSLPSFFTFPIIFDIEFRVNVNEAGGSGDYHARCASKMQRSRTRANSLAEHC